MFSALPSLVANPHVVWALHAAAEHTESAYRVVLGLGILAAVEIVAGLYMVRAGERSRGIHHKPR